MKKRRLATLLIILFSITMLGVPATGVQKGVAAEQSGQVIVYPSDDTYSIIEKPDSSFNSKVCVSQFGRVDDSGDGMIGTKIVYMKFEVPVNPKSVKLKVYRDKGKGPLEVYPVTDNNWSEKMLTWNNSPDIDRTNLLDKEPKASATDIGWVEFDLTSHITKNATYSIAIVNTVNSYCALVSKEDADKSKHAHLEILSDSKPVTAPTEEKKPDKEPVIEKSDEAPVEVPAQPELSKEAEKFKSNPAGTLSEMGMLLGDGNGVTEQYLQTKPTRIQAAVMYLRLKGLEKAAESFAGEDNFSDSQNHWAKKHMAYLKSHPELGMIGTGDNLFSPDLEISAKEYYKVMLESLGYIYEADYNWDNLNDFAAALGLKDAYSQPEFNIKALAIATVEALLTNKKNSSTSLLDEIRSSAADRETAEVLGNAKIIHVKDFGAIPDDGICDVKAICDAIDAAKKESNAVVMFDEGVYNLKDEVKLPAMIVIDKAKNMTLSGQVNSQGEPTTMLEMNLTLGNDITSGRHLDVNNSENIKIENILMDHYPRFNTVGKIVDVDKSKDVVTVDILPELPHFDGMKFYSANSWNLETKELLPQAPLSLGVDRKRFSNVWVHVPGGDGKRYKLSGFGIANSVDVGQGMSWHFNVVANEGAPAQNVFRASGNKNIIVENVQIFSAVGAAVSMNLNENITLKKVHLVPQGNSLTVTPRDGFHMARNKGKLLVEEMYIKGCRWDPFVSYMKFLKVQEIIGNNGIKAILDAGGDKLKAGDSVTFWTGERAVDRIVQSIEKISGNQYSVVFTEALPSSVAVDSNFSLGIWDWDEAIVRNSVFEGNCGTPVIFETSNVLIENNIFKNNSYSNIELGPTSNGAGSFVRNIVIQNNEFIGSTWTPKSSGGVEGGTNYGTITLFNKNGAFGLEPYNENVTIKDNIFKDINFGKEFSAIHLKNAQDVTISNNQYINVLNKIIIDDKSTKNIVNND
ncbi:MAG: DNRLRE domain-containing protein [Firmicutes bacterium]|nr:DNRLRE domain-containing protein [Bacillota bacterium]